MNIIFKYILRYSVLFLIFFVLFSCVNSAGDIKPVNTGPVPVVDTDWCESAEVNIKQLNCKDPVGNPMWVNLKGEPFATTCRILQEQGGIFIDPKCIATVSSCKEIDQCTVDANTVDRN